MDFGIAAQYPEAGYRNGSKSASTLSSAAAKVAVAAVVPGSGNSETQEQTDGLVSDYHKCNHCDALLENSNDVMAASRLQVMLAAAAAKRKGLRRRPGQLVVFRGTLVHATNSSPMDILRDRFIGVQDGKILFVEEESGYERLKRSGEVEDEQLVSLGSWEFLMPGFVDAHVHAPQYVHTGAAMDLPFDVRLKKFILSTEGGFADLAFAEEVYHRVVDRLLRTGTTTACYYATIHVNSTLKLCDIVEERGQRAYVGRCSAVRNVPGFLLEEEDQSLKETAKYVKKILAKESPLLTPVVTVKSADCSTLSHMERLAELARKHNLPVQSHIGESEEGHSKCFKLYPDHKHFADVFNSCGLYERWTAMAHATYLTDDEINLTRKKGVGIIHCPTASMSWKNGICDIRRLLDKDIKVGLGTDISSGFSPSMLSVIRSTIQASNMVSLERGPDYKALDYREAFRLATLGGSQVLGLQDTIGNFEVGKDFDALRVNPYVPDSPMDIFAKDSLRHSIEKFLYLGDDRNITEVYVAGKKIIDKTSVMMNNGH